MNPSLDTLKQAVAIKERIATLEQQLASLLGGKHIALATAKAPAASKGPNKMSAAARAKISAAVKARWAKTKSKSAKPGAKPAAKPAKKKGAMSAAGKAKLSALMKARWAARKKGAPALNAPKK